MSQAGLILGTAAYMSPEQAAGAPVDRRADIWAFGVVLWEMLSGQRLFSGDTVVQTIAAVLRNSIEFDTLDVPAPIKTLLRRCLDRDAKTRLRDIGEARVALATYLADPESGTVASGPSRPAYQWVAWAAMVVLATIAMVGWLRPRPAATGATPADLALTIAPTAGSLAPRRRPACHPRDLARRLCSDLLSRRRIVWQWRGCAGTALEHAHARTRTHRRFQKPRILVSGLAVLRVQRRDQSEEDACAGRGAGNDRKRCGHHGGWELE